MIFGLFRRRTVVLTTRKTTPEKKAEPNRKATNKKRSKATAARRVRSSSRRRPGTKAGGRLSRTVTRTARVGKAKLQPGLIKVGKITHYFRKVKAGVIKVTRGPIELGDILYFKGHTTDFKQEVGSMQIEGQPIKRARKGHMIGLRVRSRVRQGDEVYKVKNI